MSSKLFLAFQTYSEQGVYDNIKFGRKDFADNKALEIYTRRNYERRLHTISQVT